MLGKAIRTRDLRSYSLGNILFANGGNLVHSVYVYSLPLGPIWLFHSFHPITTGLMMLWYLRYEWRPARSIRLTRLIFFPSPWAPRTPVQSPIHRAGKHGDSRLVAPVGLAATARQISHRS